MKSRNWGLVKIIDIGSKYNYLKVKFLNTGNVDEFRKDAIINGEIRDKYAVSLCGVGIIGNIKTRGKYKKYYTIWKNMINRCYTPKNKAYFNNVIVCERWKTFEYFYEDIKKVDGWDLTAFERGEIVLDKDLKQRYFEKKIYSVESCSWVKSSENACVQDQQQHPFIAISPNGEVYCDYNITKFARNHNLERRQISAVLHNRYKTTNSWRFLYK